MGTDFNNLVLTHHESIEAMDVSQYIDELDEDNKSSSVGFFKEDDSKPCQISNLQKPIAYNASTSDKKEKKTRRPSEWERKKLIQDEER